MTPSALPLVDANQLADTGSLAALKQAAAKQSPQALREAARQFESLFVSMVLKSVRQANFKDPLFGSDQGDMYQDMYDDQVAAQITKGKGLGLADMLVQQLRRESGVAKPSSAPQPAAGRTPGAATDPRAATAASASVSAGTPSTMAGAAADSTLAGTQAAATTTPNDTLSASGASQSACPTSAEQASFARSLWPQAQQAAVQLGVSPVTLLAQAALETDWGRSMPGGTGSGTSNNLFGIKATSAWGGPAVQSSTREWRGGGASTLQAPFRAYASTSRCFQDYVALLRGNPRYAAALGTGGDVQAFGSALQRGGYATDPAYASKLTAVAGTLTRALSLQDRAAGHPPAVAATGGGSAPLKLAAGLPIHRGSGPLQRR